MSLAHLVHPTGDHEQDALRAEHLAWVRYVRMANTLADVPLTNGHRLWEARKRLESAKADFAQAWRALDEVIQ